MELRPQTRGTLALAGTAILLFVFVRYHRHIGLVVASAIIFEVLLYTLGGSRLPWKIKVNDFFGYVLIVLGLLVFVLLIALYEAHKSR